MVDVGRLALLKLYRVTGHDGILDETFPSGEHQSGVISQLLLVSHHPRLANSARLSRYRGRILAFLSPGHGGSRAGAPLQCGGTRSASVNYHPGQLASAKLPEVTRSRGSVEGRGTRNTRNKGDGICPTIMPKTSRVGHVNCGATQIPSNPTDQSTALNFSSVLYLYLNSDHYLLGDTDEGTDLTSPSSVVGDWPEGRKSSSIRLRLQTLGRSSGDCAAQLGRDLSLKVWQRR